MQEGDKEGLPDEGLPEDLVPQERVPPALKIPLPLYVGLRVSAFAALLVAAFWGLQTLGQQDPRVERLSPPEPISNRMVFNGTLVEVDTERNVVRPLESFSPLRSLPAEGDAPGFDLPFVPRAPGLRRRMSFQDPTGNYRSVFYSDSPLSKEELLAWYEDVLRSSGWKVLPSKAEEPLVALGFGLMLVVSTRSGGECSQSCVNVMSSPQ